MKFMYVCMLLLTGGGPVLSEPPSNKVAGEVASEEADEMGDNVEHDPSDTGDGVEASEAGDTVQSGSVEAEDTGEDVEGDSRDSVECDPSVEEEPEETVGDEAGEGAEDLISVHVESRSPEPETSKGVDPVESEACEGVDPVENEACEGMDPVESEAREGETEDDEEMEGSESSGEEDDLEEEVRATLSSLNLTFIMVHVYTRLKTLLLMVLCLNDTSIDKLLLILYTCTLYRMRTRVKVRWIRQLSSRAPPPPPPKMSKNETKSTS